MLERQNGPVGETGELLRDGLDPYLEERQLPADGTDGKLGGILSQGEKGFSLES